MNAPKSSAVLLVAAGLAIFGGAMPAYSQSSGPARFNILLILLDDLGYADVGFNADLFGIETDVVTPNIDAIARQGTIFKQAHVAHRTLRAPRWHDTAAGLKSWTANGVPKYERTFRTR